MDDIGCKECIQITLGLNTVCITDIDILSKSKSLA